MDLEKLLDTNQFGVTLAPIDGFEIKMDLEEALNLGLEMVLDQVKENHFKMDHACFYLGRCQQYNAAWFMFESLTQWDNLEESMNELLLGELLDYIDAQITWPSDQKRVELQQHLKEVCVNICEKFDIKIEAYEMADTLQIDVKVTRNENEDKWKAKCTYQGVVYVSG